MTMDRTLGLVLYALHKHACHPVSVGSFWAARCPAHDDCRPSLSIGPGRDGRVLIKCFAGCRTEDVLDAAGLTWADLFPDS